LIALTSREQKDAEEREIAELRAGLVDHAGVPLWRTSHAFVSLMMARYRALGYDDLTPAHTGLLPHLDVEGTRQTELALRAGISKQAVGQMIADLETRGYVKRVPDPVDGRARIVRYTAKGRRFVRDGWQIKRDLHERCRDIVGAKDFDAFLQTVERLAAGLEGDLGASR